MGLIKSAIYTGAGLYAVNKFAKVAETHSNNRANNRIRGDEQTREYGAQESYQQPSRQGSPLHFREPSEATRHNYQAPPYQNQQQQPLYLTSEGAYVMPYPYGDHQGRPVYETASPRYVSPPRQGYVEPESVDHNLPRGDQGDRSGQFDTLVQQAMDFASSGAKNGASSDRSQKLLSQLFSK